LLDTEVNVEEIGLLANDPDERHCADDEDWRDLAERVLQLRDTAHRVAVSILKRADALDAESWSAAEDPWVIKELAGGGGDVVDAELVDED
jgi:hypothetical protein